LTLNDIVISLLTVRLGLGLSRLPRRSPLFCFCSGKSKWVGFGRCRCRFPCSRRVCPRFSLACPRLLSLATMRPLLCFYLGKSKWVRMVRCKGGRPCSDQSVPFPASLPSASWPRRASFHFFLPRQKQMIGGLVAAATNVFVRSARTQLGKATHSLRRSQDLLYAPTMLDFSHNGVYTAPITQDQVST